MAGKLNHAKRNEQERRAKIRAERKQDNYRWIKPRSYFPARYAGPCSACPAPITKGQLVKRRAAGGWRHRNCDEPDEHRE